MTNERTGLTKVSVNFVPRAMRALDMAAEVSGDSRTDTLNRAIQVYAYIIKAEHGGKVVCIEAPDGSSERVLFF